MTIRDEAKKLGIEQPELKYSHYVDADGITVVALTPESEEAWGKYITAITQAKIALTKQTASV